MANPSKAMGHKGLAGKVPVSQHPAFPAIVALWFAALLGLGSLVVPVVLFEAIVTKTGISSIVSAARPPLGFTARLLIALAATVSGAVVGLWLARQMARSHDPSPAPRGGLRGRRQQPPRPISIRDEVGGDGLLPDSPRRRALAVTDEDAPSEFLSPAALPGDTAVLPGSPDDAPGAPFAVARTEDRPEPFDLGLAAELEAPQAATPAPVQAPAAAPAAPIHLEDPMDHEQEPAPRPVSRPNIFAPEPRFEPAGADAETAGELEDLGLVQLAQRLGASIERRRLAAATRVPAAEASAVPAAVAGDVAAARPEEAAQAMAAYFGKPAAVATPRSNPAPAFDPVFDAPAPVVPEEDRASAEPPRPATPAFLRGLAFEDDEDEADDVLCGSLLGLNNPFAPREQKFVRVDEPEEFGPLPAAAVVFPGQHDPQPAAAGLRPFDRPDEGETFARRASPEMDEALRAALAKLQRAGSSG